MGELVSVIIPTFKRNDRIENAINSVLNQNYKNIEIIIVDDNQPDSIYRQKTEDILTKYKKYKNIIYIKHEFNKGGSAARNTGIKNAKGNYIAFLDDDDLWMRDKIELQMKKIANEFFGAVYCRCISITEDNKLYRRKNNKLYKGNIFKKLLVNNFITTSMLLVKKECFDKVGLFDEKLPSRQDHDMILRIAKSYNISFADEYLVKYRVHDNRISRNIHAKEKGWDVFLNKWQYELQKFPQLKRKLYSNYYFEMAKIYLIYRKNNNATKYFFLAIKTNPFRVKAFIGLITSILRIELKIQ